MSKLIALISMVLMACNSGGSGSSSSGGGGGGGGSSSSSSSSMSLAGSTSRVSTAGASTFGGVVVSTDADRCASASTCGFAINPMYAQTDPVLLARINHDKGLNLRSETGWCAPTASTNTLLSIKSEIGATGKMNSFVDNTTDPYGIIENFGDLAGTNWSQGGTYDVSTISVFQNLYDKVSAAKKGFFQIDSPWNGADLAAYFKKYKPGGTFFVGFSQNRGGVLTRVAGHAVSFNGYAGEYVQIKDPWGRVYYVTVAVQRVSNSTISKMLAVNGYSPVYANGVMDYGTENNYVVSLDGTAGFYAF